MTVQYVRADRLTGNDTLLKGKRRLKVIHAIPNLLREGYTEIRHLTGAHPSSLAKTIFYKNDKKVMVDRN